MNTEELLISIIIPVYDVEAYLNQCVDTVLTQSYQHMEIILVDDGSLDRSPAICDEYAEKDMRVRVIHQENKGLSEARNTGIRAAKGDYLLFLDGDDFYDDEDAVSRLVKRAESTHAEVISFSYQKYWKETEKKERYHKPGVSMSSSITDKEEQTEFLTSRHLFIASACNKLISRSLLERESLFFRGGVYSEDIEWCARLLMKARSLDYVDECFYCYRQRENSITHSMDMQKCMHHCQNILTCFSLTEEASPEIRVPLYRYTAYQYATFFHTVAYAERKPKDCMENLAPYAWVLRYDGGSNKVRMLHAACSILGYRNLCKLIRVMYRRKR